MPILTVLLTALLALTHVVNSSGEVAKDIYIKANPHLPVEQIAKAIRPFGKLDSRTPGTSIYAVELRPNVDEELARASIARVSGLRPLDPEEDPIDMQSVRSLHRKIADLSRDEIRERKKGNTAKAEKEKEGADYLKAYRHFVGQRAYPNDKVDWSAYSRATAHVAGMKRAVLPGSGTRAPGQTWSFMGPTNLKVPYEQYYGISPVNGRFNAVAFDPNSSQIIYGGAAQGGVWKSTDSGVTWSWLSSSWTHLGVNCIVIDPNNSSTIYVGLGDYHGFIGNSNGIMKSTDGGVTWNEIATATMGNVGVASILIDPTSSQTLLAGTGDIYQYGKLYRSTNGGQTWTAVTNLARSDWPTIAASSPVGNSVRIYAIAAGYGNSNSTSITRIYKSDDHGATWQALASPVVTNGTVHWAYAVATSPTDPNNVYVLDSENNKIYSSTNQGGTWKDISANFPLGNEIQANYNFSQSYYDYHLECGSRVISGVTKDVIFVGEIDIVQSADNGVTWKSLGGPTYSSNAISHNDQHALAVCPTDPNLAIFSNDGGIYAVRYNPVTNSNNLTSLNKNLGGSMFYYIAMHPTDPNILVGGTQDNASPVASGDLSNWRNSGGGDGGGSAINQSNPAIQYTTSENFFFFRTDDGWSFNQSVISPNSGSDPVPFIATVKLAPTDQTKLYTGTNFLYRFNDSSQTWTNHVGNQRLAGPVTSSSTPLIQAIAIAPTDASRIYTGSTDGQIWMSTNAGTSWKQLNSGTTGLPNFTITSLSISPSNASDILIGYSGSGASHLWRCQNTVATTPAFTNVSGSGANTLPDISLNAIERDFDSPTTIWWVGTDFGVFRSTDSGATWANAGSALGLPNVIVDDLVAVPGTRYLNAGTYGRGVWRILLPAVPADLSSMTLAASSVRRGKTVQGTVTLTSAAPQGGLVVQLSSSNTGVATVPASVTVPAGSTSAAFTVSTPSGLTTPGSSTITAIYQAVTRTQTLNVTVPTISGTLSFSDFAGLKPSSVTLNFRLPGASTPFTTMIVPVDAAGKYVAQNVPTQAYSVYVQVGTWLRRTLSLDLTTNDALNANYVLINGDIDGNNRIDTTDRRLLSVANGSTSISSNWNPRADLNGDGLVDGLDYTILYKNMNKVGDK